MAHDKMFDQSRSYHASAPVPPLSEQAVLSHLPPETKKIFTRGVTSVEMLLADAPELDPKNPKHRLSVILSLLDGLSKQERMDFVDSIGEETARGLNPLLEAHVTHFIDGVDEHSDQELRALWATFELALASLPKTGPMYERLVEISERYNDQLYSDDSITL